MQALSHHFSLVGRTLGVFLGVLCLMLIGQVSAATAADTNYDFTEEEVTFSSDGVQLDGSVLLPEGHDEPVPGIVLIHGAGSHSRDAVRQHAEAFTELGVATLIYEKRHEGYSQFERSYELLAEDALAAVDTLREHPAVDAEAVGVWGLSEGAWVGPLAATHSADIAFVIPVGASGVPPIQQTSWALDNTFAKQGVEGSLRHMVTTNGLRFLRGVDAFAEADYDPVPALQQLDVPVLAMWGTDDHTAPPTESAEIFAQAIDHPNGPPLALRSFPNAGHELKDASAQLAPDYPETVTTWVNDVASTGQPSEARDDFPLQERTSTALAPLAWWESEWAQLIVLVILGVGFLAYPIATVITTLRRLQPQSARVVGDTEASVQTPATSTTNRVAVALAAIGLLAIVGFFLYYGTVMFSSATMLGPIVGTRPVMWLMLQALAVVTVVLGIVLALRVISARHSHGRSVPVSMVLLLVAAVVFIPWAGYWGLLLP